MADITMGLTPKSLKDFYQILNYLRLPPKIRKQVMQKVLWRMKDKAKKSVSHQTSPDGKNWQPRKKLSKGKRGNKMLKKAAVYLNSKIENQGSTGRLRYADKKTSKILAVHQYGESVEVKQSPKEREELKRMLANMNQPATPKQIKRLKELGYTQRIKSKSGKIKQKKANSQLRNSMTQGQAGLIIRMLEEKQGIKVRRGLSSYKMAKRTFLDEDDQRNSDIITEELLKGFSRAGIHLQT